MSELDIYLCDCDPPNELNGDDGNEFDLRDENGNALCPECEQRYKPVPYVPASDLAKATAALERFKHGGTFENEDNVWHYYTLDEVRQEARFTLAENYTTPFPMTDIRSLARELGISENLR